MAKFLSPIDIANRACQHLGARQIDESEGFNEDSVQAKELGTVYDKLRLAELRRNTWRYSTRRSVLRPVGHTTMFVDAPLWSSSTVYNPGAIVKTVEGFLWTSNARNNKGNLPGMDARWDGYFGPLTVEEWRQPTAPNAAGAYFAGDVVYVVAANGIPTVYRSLVNNNSDDPATAESWMATLNSGRRKYYFKGDVVSYSGALYQSLIDLNGNNVPGSAPTPYNAATVYSVGEQVTGSDGVTYMALVAGTLPNPANNANPANWTQGGLSNPNNWSASTTYAAGDQVAASNGVIYYSLQAANTNNEPSVSPTYWTSTGAFNPWTTTITTNSGSLKWAKVELAVRRLLITYPLGCGPYEESSSRNIYRLPAGYLRWVPQDPKAGQTSVLGAPTNAMPDDWLYEGDYFVTKDSYPINFRFVADIRNVAEMDPLFCEGLGARAGMETCERVTGSTSKIQICTMAYKSAIQEARLIDGIEQGFIEPPLDNYLVTRY